MVGRGGNSRNWLFFIYVIIKYGKESGFKSFLKRIIKKYGS